MRRLLSLDYLIERPTLGWLPTEDEKVQRFEALGLDQPRPSRTGCTARGKPKAQPRYFAFKLPIAVDEQAATFVYVDAGQSTDSELRAWGGSARALMGGAPRPDFRRPRRRRRHGRRGGADAQAPVLKYWTQDGDGTAASRADRRDQGRPGNPSRTRPD